MIYIRRNNNDSNIKSKISTFFDYLTMIFDICDYIYTNKSSISKDAGLPLSVFNVIIRDNRAFVYFNRDKYVSVYFPFGFSSSDDRFYLNKYLIDTKRISHLRTILDSIKNEGSFLEGMKNCNDGVSPSDPDYATDEDKDVFSEVCMLEAGYLRFDFDTKNAKGKIHPLNHLDINYSKDATYKIGLHEKMKPEMFLQILDNSKERYFIEKESRWKRWLSVLLRRKYIS